MNFFKKLLKDDDELYNSEYKNDFSAEQDSGELIDDVPTAGGENVAAGESAGGKEVSLRVMRPKGYDDGPEIADYVASGCTVVMNIEDLNRENARRLIDFLLGAVYVIGGDLQMASQTTFVVAPCSVAVNDNGEPDDDHGLSDFTFK